MRCPVCHVPMRESDPMWVRQHAPGAYTHRCTQPGCYRGHGWLDLGGAVTVTDTTVGMINEVSRRVAAHEEAAASDYALTTARPRPVAGNHSE